MDQPDEAWLLELAARVDDGLPIDWPQVEAAAGAEALQVIRALRVIESMAIRGRHRAAAIESAAVTAEPSSQPPTPLATPPSEPPEDAPVSDRYRSIAPSSPEEIRRKLLFGAALVLSLASVLVGLLLQSRTIQFVLVGMAVVIVFIALFTAAKPPAPPPAGSPDGSPRA